jgi:hypothetical protein
MRSFFLKLFLVYAICLTAISCAIFCFLLFVTKLYRLLNNRLFRETEWLLDKYEKTLHVSGSKK